MSKSKTHNVKLIKEYKTLLETDYTYYCYYGGRGGGKTENIAIVLAIMALGKENLKILCIRELAGTVRDSVRQAIVDAIFEIGAEEFFDIKVNRIVCKRTGSQFLFSGMSEQFARKIKSIKGINITWLEEASDITERSWLTLLPSVLRTPSAKMIISFNPFSEDDIVYRQFISGTPPYNSYVKKVCYYDNPFFKDSPLEQQRKHQQETLPYQVYAHVWEGEILKDLAEALFTDEIIGGIYTSNFEYSDIAKIVISCDPAATNKDYSNEYGVMALGKLNNGVIVLLKDYSTKASPSEFVSIVCSAYAEWKEVCSDICVVAEVNQGGDFIKHAILSKNPTIQVEEVRAGADKIQRAIPIANLCALGRVKFDKAFDFNKLIRQMKLITHKGFIGIKGESPDRVDAFVWGVFYLADLKNFDSIDTYYQGRFFEHDKTFSFVDMQNIVFTFIDTDSVYVIRFDLISNASTQKRVLVKDSAVFTHSDFITHIHETPANLVVMPNCELSKTIPINYSVYNTATNHKNVIAEEFSGISASNIMFDLETIPNRRDNLHIGQLLPILASSYQYEKQPHGLIICMNYLSREYKYLA